MGLEYLGPVADADDSHLRSELRQDLPARAAWWSGRRSRGVDHERLDPLFAGCDGVEYRVALGTDRESVAGIFNVAPRHDFSGPREYGGANSEVAVLRVGVGRRTACGGFEFLDALVCHFYWLDAHLVTVFLLETVNPSRERPDYRSGVG